MRELIFHADGIHRLVICVLVSSSILVGLLLYCLFDDRLLIIVKKVLDRDKKNDSRKEE